MFQLKITPALLAVLLLAAPASAADTPTVPRFVEETGTSGIDMAEPEVMLDVEVLEITRSKLVELGIRFPDQIGYGLLQPSTNS